MDTVYRFLSEVENLERFQRQLFKWEGNELLSEIPASNYISKFMVYKTQYDVKEMIRLQSILQRYPGKGTREYRLLMEYPNTRMRMLLGYKDEIEGKGRNCCLHLPYM